MLANPKTIVESGLDYVKSKLDLRTPFGMQILKALEPFMPGQEDELLDEFDRLSEVIGFIEQDNRALLLLREIFMDVKDVSTSVIRSGSSVLSVVELFDIKLMCLQMRDIRRLTTGLPKTYVPEDVSEIIQVLDPRNDGISSFYIYEEYSDKLRNLRDEKSGIQKKIRRVQNIGRENLKEKYGVNLTPKFDLVLSRNHKDFDFISSLEELEVISQDYMSVTFSLVADDEINRLKITMDEVTAQIAEEEERVCGVLSKKIFTYKDTLLENIKRIGALDFSLAKAVFTRDYDLKRPQIVDEHILEYEDGKNIQVAEALAAKSLNYQSVSLSLREGVSLITGANMGGKTVTLKLSMQIAILAQYGFFVPAKSAKLGLSSFMQMLIGDSQSLERGLSSFGSEMEELKEILNKAGSRSLIMIDEIASGTNPSEGTALTKSVVSYLSKRDYISVITTHYEVSDVPDIVNMQVRGLRDVDFGKISKKIATADRKMRIQTISEYMDYRLFEVTSDTGIPHDGINIASILGLEDEIIQSAKEFLNKG